MEDTKRTLAKISMVDMFQKLDIFSFLEKMDSKHTPMDFAKTMSIVTKENDENNCPICFECLDSKSAYKLECGHEFHSECIIQWFRYPENGGTCPMCRSAGRSLRNKSFMDRKACLKNNIAFSKRVGAPKHLKTLVKRYKTMQKKRRERLAEFRAWKKSEDGLRFKELHKIYRKGLRNQWAGYRCPEGCLERQIANYPIIPIRISRNNG